MTTPGRRAGWRTSTRSNNGSDCVEVDFTTTGVEMRDSKAHGTGPIIDFTPAQWAVFLDDLSSGGGAVTITHHHRGTQIRSTDGRVTLHFTLTEWAAFIAGAQDGEFDYHTQAAALTA